MGVGDCAVGTGTFPTPLLPHPAFVNLPHLLAQQIPRGEVRPAVPPPPSPLPYPLSISLTSLRSRSPVERCVQP